MNSKNKNKIVKKLLESLNEKAPLSTNKGVFIRQKYPSVNRKTRRHSGRYTPWSEYPRKALEENMIFLQEEYDNWNNYRDGMRGDEKVNIHSFWMEENRDELIRLAKERMLKKKKIRQIERLLYRKGKL